MKRAEENNIRFSKGGTGKKNDNRYAGQKNKSAVRDIAAYCRYSGERGTAALQAVCNACGLLPGLFYPCMKLVSKERADPEYRKRYDAAKSPYRRLIERETAGHEAGGHWPENFRKPYGAEVFAGRGY